MYNSPTLTPEAGFLHRIVVGFVLDENSKRGRDFIFVMLK